LPANPEAEIQKWYEKSFDRLPRPTDDALAEADALGKVDEIAKAVVDCMAERWEGFDEKAVWSTARVNRLPDSSFLYIAPGGKKDDTGKTVPRSLRYFPVKDENGKPDAAHVRNALARIPQADIPASAKASATRKARALAKELGIGEKSHSKQATPAIGREQGERELPMDEQTIKQLIETMNKAQFDALPKAVQKELVEFDGGLEARLENAELRARLKAAEDKADEAEKGKAEAEKKAEAAAAKEPEEKPAEKKGEAEGDEKAAKGDKPMTAAEIQKLVVQAVQAAMGKAGKKSEAGETKSLAEDTGVRVKAFAEEKIDPEVDEATLQKRLIGAFIAGNKETHRAIHKMVHDLGQPAEGNE
jgi:hypothetical protein